MWGNARRSSRVPVEGHAVNSPAQASPKGVTSTLLENAEFRQATWNMSDLRTASIEQTQET
jgi:hypothetical protein